MNGYRALDFVRFRHTDSDLYRNARQQLFVRAFKDQIEAASPSASCPQVIKVVTSNVEVGQGGGKDVSPKTVLRYAALPYSLPTGHIFQSRIDGLEGFADLVDRAGEHRAGRAGVQEPRRRVAAEGDRGRARREAEAEGAAATRDERPRAERQRRRGLRVDARATSSASAGTGCCRRRTADGERADATTTSAPRSTSTHA